METLAHGVAGSLGGALAMGVLYPLDQIKTIMQVERQAPPLADEDEEKRRRAARSKTFWVQALAIIQEQKWRVYQGHVSTQVALGGSNFVYFFCYNGLKSALLQKLHALDPARYPAGSNVITPVQNLVLSCVAGVINVYATAPLWVANMRLKSKDHAKYRGVLDCMRQIVRSEGLLSLWNGTLASLILVSNPVIHYVSYERMKTAIQLRRAGAGAGDVAFSAMEIFVLGALAKSLTTVVTYPLQVAQSLMRVQQKQKQADAPLANGSGSSGSGAATAAATPPPPPPPPPSDGIVACLAQIYKEDGVAGWFAGLEAKLLQTVLTAAISLVTYEKLLAIILLIMKPQPKALVEKAQA